MRTRVLLVLIVCTNAYSENLILNPGFDEVNQRGMPEHWDLFVMPMDGAAGRLDGKALSEPFSAMLYNPEPYPSEPANNWSQTIIAEVEGLELVLRGSIMTEEATEAALWLQCFQKNPPRVLAAVTTSTLSPVYGNMDWTAVEARLRVPTGTRFLVLRCVLQGRGGAWFDALRLEDAAALEEGEVEDLDVLEPEPEDLGDEQAEMLLTLEELRGQNEALFTRIRALEIELSTMRGESSVPAPEGAVGPIPRPRESHPESISPRASAAPRLQEPRHGHPLVPHDYRGEGP